MSNDLVVLENQLKPLAPRFEAALAGMMPVERLMRTVLISVERTPKLLQCSRESIFSAAMSAAVLGLEVDGVTGQAFLVPFAGKAQLIIGYKGFNTIAARNGITIYGAVVREGDEFDHELGSVPRIHHKPQLGNERNRKIIAAYACAAAKDRPLAPVVMSLDEIMAIKAKSAGARREDSPWNDPFIGFAAMAEKCPKRRLARSLPAAAFQRAARLDEAVEEEGKHAFLREDGAVVIDGEAEKPTPTQKPQPSARELLGKPNAGSAGASAGPQPPVQSSTPADAAAPSDIVGGYKKKINEATRDRIAAIVEEAKIDPDLFPLDRDDVIAHARKRYSELGRAA